MKEGVLVVSNFDTAVVYGIIVFLSLVNVSNHLAPFFLR